MVCIYGSTTGDVQTDQWVGGIGSRCAQVADQVITSGALRPVWRSIPAIASEAAIRSASPPGVSRSTGGLARHKAWPQWELVETAASGHAGFEAEKSAALVAATDRFAG